MGKNYWRLQIGIREIVQLNSNKHCFQKQPLTVSYKIGVLKFRRIHMKALRSVTLIKRDPSAGAFLWILRNLLEPFFTEHLRTTASRFFFIHLIFFLPPSKLIETRFFYLWTCFIKVFERDEYHELCIQETLPYEKYDPRISLKHQDLSGV